MMDSSSILLWLKSLSNVFIIRDNFTLLPKIKSLNVNDQVDRNNNELAPNISAKRSSVYGNMNDNSKLTNNHQIMLNNSSIDDVTVEEKCEINSEQSIQASVKPYQVTFCNSSDYFKVFLGCKPLSNCDMSNQSSTESDSSLKVYELKSYKSLKSSKVIEAIIDVIKNQLSIHFDPYVVEKSHNLQINSLITICITRAKICGLSNVLKAESDGIIRSLGKNRFSVDCTIEMNNLQCNAQYVVKFGQRWHRRPSMHNKSLCVNLERCIIYVQMIVNTNKETIRFERFTPISQRQFRCKTKAFAKMSCDNLFTNLLQRKFERYFAANVLNLENTLLVHLNKTSIFNYDIIVNQTALHKLFDCFK